MTLHDLISEFESEFAALVARFRSHPAVQAAAPAPAAPVAVESTLAKPAFDWTPYAGQTDRSAFMIYVQKTGKAPDPEEQARAYAAGVVKTETHDQSSGDLHNDPNLGLGGNGYAVSLTSGNTPVTKVVDVSFALDNAKEPKAAKRLKVSPNPNCGLTSVHVEIPVLSGDAELNSAMGGNEAKFLVGSLPDGTYPAKLTIVGWGDVVVTLANA